MHILFVHQNYPAQFGHIAERLAKNHGFRCTFVTERPPAKEDRVERIQYKVRGGARAENHFCSRSFENAVWHSHAVFETLKARPDVQPDLIVGHSGFLSTAFLRELYDCPIVSFFEYYYRTIDSDMDFRPDFPANELTRLRAHTRNATLLVDLEHCDAGYSPTQWQRNRLPAQYHEKVRVIFDGIDTNLWRPTSSPSRRISGHDVPDDMKIVSYVARGFESMRGFDIFMQTAKRICDRRRDVLFVVVGEDRCCYGGDERITGRKSFKEWVMSRDSYDSSRFVFTGRLPQRELAKLLSVTDLHMYWTVPFVLSWSLFNALACGAVVLASDTAPVRELIEHERNGLLVDFFDLESWVETAERMLENPEQYRPLGKAGAELIREQYSLDVCLPQLLRLFDDVLA